MGAKWSLALSGCRIITHSSLWVKFKNLHLLCSLKQKCGSFSSSLIEFLMLHQPFFTCNCFISLRSNQILWLWVGSTNPDWLEEWTLHCKWITWCRQAARDTGWFYWEVCPVPRLWQSWNCFGRVPLFVFQNIWIASDLYSKGTVRMLFYSSFLGWPITVFASLSSKCRRHLGKLNVFCTLDCWLCLKSNVDLSTAMKSGK